MVDATDAHSTDLENPEDVHDLSSKYTCAARRRANVADELWVVCGKGEAQSQTDAKAHAAEIKKKALA